VSAVTANSIIVGIFQRIDHGFRRQAMTKRISSRPLLSFKSSVFNPTV
jgi:hypothetical protein